MHVQYWKFKKKKTQKGNSYAIVKFSDLSNVFELFIFSDIYETNRDNLIEGNSLMITLIKNYTDDKKLQKRINIKRIISLKELINQQIKNITFKFSDIKDLKKIEKLSLNEGKTEVKIFVNENDENLVFYLKNKRKINNEVLNSLNLIENVVID